ALAVGAAGGYLEHVAARRVAVLSDEQDLRVRPLGIGQDGEYGRGPRVPDQLEFTGGAVREADGIDRQIDDTSTVNGPAIEQARRCIFVGSCAHAVRTNPAIPIGIQLVRVHVCRDALVFPWRVRHVASPFGLTSCSTPCCSPSIPARTDAPSPTTMIA